MIRTILVPGVAWPPYTPPVPQPRQKRRDSRARPFRAPSNKPSLLQYIEDHPWSDVGAICAAAPSMSEGSVRVWLSRARRTRIIQSAADPKDTTRRSRVYAMFGTPVPSSPSVAERTLAYIDTHPGCTALEIAKGVYTHRAVASACCRGLVAAGRIRVETRVANGRKSNYFWRVR